MIRENRHFSELWMWKSSTCVWHQMSFVQVKDIKNCITREKSLGDHEIQLLFDIFLIADFWEFRDCLKIGSWVCFLVFWILTCREFSMYNLVIRLWQHLYRCMLTLSEGNFIKLRELKTLQVDKFSAKLQKKKIF